ncbi:membrane protein [Arthrobacter phage BaileyBlu]|uniref:Membrane protein n=1 Tax=Arthrobacter phage BaileyBlu TaxID=2910754 RepID=A0AA49BQ52_9CAUD|nr:membrane protein [Arthrobacter phage BaileyBlu]UJQ87169.1 membrane protein [Arthrobacter phage BaileyBlu]
MGVLLILATIVMAVLTFGGFVAIPLWLVFLPLAVVVGAGLVSLAVFLITAYVIGKGA